MGSQTVSGWGTRLGALFGGPQMAPIPVKRRSLGIWVRDAVRYDPKMVAFRDTPSGHFGHFWSLCPQMVHVWTESATSEIVSLILIRAI